jgi:radical SAM superfamily enzyme YgiQ (UPF0313 family)
MKLLLAYISGEPDRSDPYISLLPTGLCYLHALLREEGYDSVLANFSGWTDDAITAELERTRPDIIGISQWTHNRHASLHLANLFRRRNPEGLVIFGGAHATFRHAELLAEGSPVDIVVLGEAEATLPELLEKIGSGAPWRDLKGIACRRAGIPAVNQQRSPLHDLDALPFPARHLDQGIGIDHERQPEFILTARGCPSACHFCSSPSFWGRRVRFRSPEAIVDEIMEVRERCGLLYFSLRDDTFTAHRDRIVEFCRLMTLRRAGVLWNCQSRVNALDEELLIRMKRAGCECIQLGVESGSPRILKRLGKSISPAQVERAAALVHRVGINLSVYLISDVPGEEEADLGMTIELLRRIRPDDGYVSPLAYYPGTRLFEQDAARGAVPPDVFETSVASAIYAAGRPGRASRRLLQALATARQPPSAALFRQQREVVGYCHTTCVLAGEWYRAAGNHAAAEREFREIATQEPDNPWGWLLLAELYEEGGNLKRARECYRRVHGLVPNHAPARQALDMKKAGP